MRRFRRPVGTREKRSASDPVSDADLAAQHAMVEVVRTHRPDDGVLGEEQGMALGGERQWLLDPIDGTLAFLAGLPLWSCAVALRDGDDTLAAAILDPVAGDLFLAERTRPATLNGRAIRVAPSGPLRSAVVRTWCDPHVAQQPGYLPALERLATSTAALHAGGSGSQALAWLACGRLDGWVELYPHGAAKAWDWHPGELIVIGGGGHARSAGEWRIAAASERLADELEAALAV